MSDIDVLVVGAGPTGLTLASELLRRGLSVRLIDKAAEPSVLSRAIAVHARTLEILSDLGAADDLASRGVRLVGATVRAGGETVARVDFDGLETRFPFVLSVAQSETEACLGRLLARHGGAVERGAELVSLEAHDDHVIAKIKTTAREGEREESVRAAWVVGSDGAHSAVRHAVGAAFEGHGYDDRFVLADVVAKAEDGAMPPDRVSTFFAEDGIAACFPMANGRFRVILTVDTDDAPTIEGVEALLRARSGAGVKLSDGVWIAPFRIHCRQVERYRYGRVFLAGDAAHIHSPVGGQGMNTGIQDAHNLAWKIALTHRGHGTEALLDSYGEERHAVGRALLKTTDTATRLGTVKGVVKTSVRNAIARFVTSFEHVRRRVARDIAELDIGYEKSSIVGDAGGRGPRPGTFAPETRRVTGDAFSVVAFGRSGVETDALAAKLAPRFGARVRVVHADSTSEEARRWAVGDGGLFVVRPDLYVGFRAPRAAEAAVAEHLAKVLV